MDDVTSSVGDLPDPGMGEDEALLRGLIHEVRHPLMGIKAGLVLISGALGEQVRQLDEWELVTSQVARMEEMLQGYQELMQRGDGEAVDFSVEPVLGRALDVLRFRLRRLGPRFAVEVQPGLPPAHGSPRALLHAVTNLVANALDALEEVGAPARLTVRALVVTAAPHLVQIRVSDEGPGIPPAQRAQIFEAGFTTKARRTGSGLGLFVTRRMLSARGGAVRVVDEGDAARLAWARTELAVELPVREGPP